MNVAIDGRVVIDGTRRRLVKLAGLLLRNDERAEDAVEQAMRTASGPADDVAAGSDLIGILKDQIADQLRRRQAEVGADAGGEDDGSETIDGLFGANGRRAAPVADWGDAQIASSRREFTATLEACVGQLPPALAQVLLMREWMQCETGTICRVLGIAEAECHARLFRARLLLGTCLQRRWFAGRAGEA
jgi:RNA polymerase sigma-70 factor (TIGR02943 family)